MKLLRATDKPAGIPEGMSHLEFVLGEAEKSFQAGDHKSGVVNLCHALHVLAVKREDMDDFTARRWFSRITNAAGAWE